MAKKLKTKQKPNEGRFTGRHALMIVGGLVVAFAIIMGLLANREKPKPKYVPSYIKDRRVYYSGPLGFCPKKYFRRGNLPFKPTPINWDNQKENNCFGRGFSEVDMAGTKIELCLPDPEEDKYNQRAMEMKTMGLLYTEEIGELNITLLRAKDPVGRGERENTLVVDVGAHLGEVTIWAASMGHPVISLEPQRKHRKYFIQSVLHNNLQDKIKLYPYAAYDKSGEEVEMYELKHNSAYSFIPPEQWLKNKTSNPWHEVVEKSYELLPEKVRTVRLEDVVDRYIGVLRIAPEGTVGRILAGAEKIIRRDGCLMMHVLINLDLEQQNSCEGYGIINVLYEHLRRAWFLTNDSSLAKRSQANANALNSRTNTKNHGAPFGEGEHMVFSVVPPKFSDPVLLT